MTALQKSQDYIKQEKIIDSKQFRKSKIKGQPELDDLLQPKKKMVDPHKKNNCYFFIVVIKTPNFN